MISPTTLLTTFLLALPTHAQSSTYNFRQVHDFGPNPRNVSFWISVPPGLTTRPPNYAHKPAIIVDPHWCHGTAQNVFDYRPWAKYGEQYGFISIFPNTSNPDQCWDVSSRNGSLKHDGGGDARGIASMVRWALEIYGGDPDRVFVTGTSSGAMMTNVLLGSYPDLFAAGSAWAGVPFGCYAADGFDVWSDDCAKGKIIKNGTGWGDMVRDAYPEYDGYRPKVQTFHGNKDDVLYPQNFEEQIKQWTDVFGVSDTPESVEENTPLEGWTKYSYGEKFEAYELEGVTHDIPVNADLVMDFFDLRCTGEERECFSRKSK